MENLIIKNYNQVINNQIRLKLNNTSMYTKGIVKKISFLSFFNKIESFKNSSLLEFLFFFRFITNKKSYIFNFKKKYKEFDFSLKLDLQKKNVNFFLMNYLIFYFPVLYRRELLFNKSFNSGNEFIFVNDLYNILPFFPDIFFSSTQKVQYQFSFIKANRLHTLLFLSYYNIPIKGEK